MKRSIAQVLASSGLAVTLVLAAVLGTAATTSAAPVGNCSLHTLKGQYASTISGWVTPSTGDRQPYGATGSVVIDGHGNITGTIVQSLDGVITGPFTLTGTYTVDPDTCTGTASSTIGTFFFAIAANGKQTRIVGTTPGTTVTGESIRR